jgi:hypothetical protein
METDDDERTNLPLSPASSSLGGGSASVLPPGARARPLVSGSAAHSRLIRDLDEKIQHVERFHARRSSLAQYTVGPEVGYATFDEAAADMTEIFNLAWKSSNREYYTFTIAVANCT